MFRFPTFLTVVFLFSLFSPAGLGQEERGFARADNRFGYTHHIELLDSSKNVIDPEDQGSRPYSPKATCGKCHDYAHIGGGFHTSLFDQDAWKGRPGEPWFWVDAKSGSRIPLSFRSREGAYDPKDVGLDHAGFVKLFGGHLAGLGPDVALRGAGGDFEIDCMICHSADRGYDPVARAEQLEKGNFQWAATVAMGLASVEGSASSIPEGASEKEIASKLPKTTYDPAKFDSQGRVFFDVVRTPSDRHCYFCHDRRPSAPRWRHDEDVHLRAGMSCVDCHRHGLDHDMERGLESRGVGDIDESSCRGCHEAGRLGAPALRHEGLPPLHLETISCTSCHAGGAMDAVQTARAHGLGLPSQNRDWDLAPRIEGPFWLDGEEQVEPQLATWPSFWALRKEGRLHPCSPDDVNRWLRRSLRVRRDFETEMRKASLNAQDRESVLGSRTELPEEELTQEELEALEDLKHVREREAFEEKLTKGLTALGERHAEASPVYVSNGLVYSLDGEGALKVEPSPEAKAIDWPLAHDVRPARMALGATGCQKCHAPEADFFHGKMRAQGPAPTREVSEESLSVLRGEDQDLVTLWETSFSGREWFKWGGVLAISFSALALLASLIALLIGMTRNLFNRRNSGEGA